MITICCAYVCVRYVQSRPKLSCLLCRSNIVWFGTYLIVSPTYAMKWGTFKTL